MDKVIRNVSIGVISLVGFLVSYHYFVFAPNQEILRLEQAVKQLQEENATKLLEVSHKMETSSVAPLDGSYDSADAPLQQPKTAEYMVPPPKNQTLNNDAKEAKEAYEKQQKTLYNQQLSRDKASYNEALEELARDYEYARDKVNAQIVKNGLTEPYEDCADGTRDEQRCQINNRAYEEYQIELDYLEKTYKANLKSLSALKYW